MNLKPLNLTSGVSAHVHISTPHIIRRPIFNLRRQILKELKVYGLHLERLHMTNMEVVIHLLI